MLSFRHLPFVSVWQVFTLFNTQHMLPPSVTILAQAAPLPISPDWLAVPSIIPGWISLAIHINSEAVERPWPPSCPLLFKQLYRRHREEFSQLNECCNVLETIYPLTSLPPLPSFLPPPPFLPPCFSTWHKIKYVLSEKDFFLISLWLLTSWGNWTEVSWSCLVFWLVWPLSWMIGTLQRVCF